MLFVFCCLFCLFLSEKERKIHLRTSEHPVRIGSVLVNELFRIYIWCRVVETEKQKKFKGKKEIDGHISHHARVSVSMCVH
jgi:hypothetical protein